MDKYSVLLKGPFLSQSGYGEQARFALRAMRSREDIFDLYLVNTGWGSTSWVGFDGEEREYIDQKLQDTIGFHQNGGQFDASMVISIPNEFEKHAPVNIIYTAGIETNKIAPEWIEKCNGADRIITISNHSKFGFDNTTYEAQDERTGQIYKNYRCETPVNYVNYPVRDMDSDRGSFNLSKVKTDFNFLCMAQWSPRKNLANTIRWFVEEFMNREVGLILKVSSSNNSLIDRRQTKQRIKKILDQYEQRSCKVYLLHGNLEKEEIKSLYNHKKVKALVSATHGEGFGLPLFEMSEVGKPVVAPDWSGHTDFLYKDNEPMFANVDYTIRPVGEDAVWEGVIHPSSMWCYPEANSFKMALREVYEQYDEYKETAEELSEYIKEKFTKEKQYKKFSDIVLSTLKGEDNSFVDVQVID